MMTKIKINSLIVALATIFTLTTGSYLYADPIVISGSQQMSVNTSQTLTASGGTLPYSWNLIKGNGTLSPVNDHATGFQSANTNPGCVNNAVIRVADSSGQYADFRIAVNAYDPNEFAYKIKKCFSEWSCGSDEFCAVVKIHYGYCDNRISAAYDWCGGGSQSPEQDCGFCAKLGRSSCADVALTSGCGTGGIPSYIPIDTPFDIRTTAQKQGGCCPAAEAEEGESSNNTGKKCPTNVVPYKSAVNFKSGNLFHSQETGKLTLSYNSIDINDGPVGEKWTHSYNQKLSVLSDNATVKLQTDDGNLIFFRLSGGAYYPDNISGDTSSIVKNANGSYTQTTKSSMIYQYDSTGKLASIQDRNGRTTILTYNGADLAGITDFNGRTTTITNTNGKITGLTDFLGRTFIVGYTNGIITTITDPMNNTWHFSYDANNWMLTKTDPAGRQITYTYDANGKVLTATDVDGKVKTMNYSEDGLTSNTEEDGGLWTYKYDATYTVITEATDPKGNATKYAYDLKRNLIKKTLPDGSFTTYSYDDKSNLTSTTDPMGKTTTYTYNAQNLVSNITNPKGKTTQYGYDGNGNLTSITDPLNNVTRYQYDSRGNITAIINPLGKTTTMTYDGNNNLTSITDPKSGTTIMTYDNVGNMLTQTDALNKTTTFQYNGLNQLIKVTDPKGYVTNYTYDYNGNRLSATDANGKATQYLYNYKDKLTSITDALSEVTQLAYGPMGCGSNCGGSDKLTAVTDAKNQTTSFDYDTTGNLSKETDPLGKATTFAYDSKGNLITRTSPDNKTITYTYDLNNRLIQKDYSDSSVASFQYDDAGNMTYAGNQNISYTFTYDANNRITRIVDSNGRTIQYSYDAAGNRTSMITPDNRTISYGYDNNNLLASISNNLGSFTFSYDAINRRIGRTLPNGTTSTYSYDEDGRLTGMITVNSRSTIDSTTYTHDYVGNRLTKTTPQESCTFGYDGIYRIIQATPTGGNHQAETYTYDQVGNRLTKANETPPASNETATYTYDDENRLSGVQIIRYGKTRQLSFAYDPFGRRISKTIIKDEIGTGCTAPSVCPRTTTYIYDNQNIIMEYNANGEIQTRYTHGPNIDEPLAIDVKSGATYTPYYYHADGLGSITALSDANGNISQRYEYDTFGNPTITAQGNINQPYTFTGREYDQETGMYFYRARYYDPKIGRFVT